MSASRVTGTETPAAPGRRTRPGSRLRIDLAAALLIAAFVVGIPWFSSGTARSGARPAPTFATLQAPGPSPANTTPDAAGDPTSPAPVPGYPDFEALLTTIGAPAFDTAQSTTGPTTPRTPGRGSPGPGSNLPAPLSPSPLPTAAPVTSPPPTAAPGAPANLRLDFTSPTLGAGWDAVTTRVDGTALEGATYEVTIGGGGRAMTYETAAPRFTYPFDQNRADFGTPQPELTVTVQAVDGNRSHSGAVVGVAVNERPATPVAPPALTGGPTSVTITAPAQPGTDDVAGFEIYHSAFGDGPFDLVLAYLSGTDTFVHNVLPGTTHYYVYRVRDVFGQVSAGFSPTASITVA